MQSRNVLKGKTRLLGEEEKKKRPKKCDSLSDKEVNKLGNVGNLEFVLHSH